MAKKDKLVHSNEENQSQLPQHVGDALGTDVLVTSSVESSLRDEIESLKCLVDSLTENLSVDTVVLDGKRYLIEVNPMRADMVLDSVKKGYIHENQTVVIINRYE